MSETLLSVGLDVGTTSTQLVVSRLKVENRAGSFAVPELEIAGREILYKSPIHFTPLLSGKLVDGEKLRELVDGEYRAAGIEKNAVDTGAVIITGETSRKENAASVLEALAEYAGDFVVATAGPELESARAARGAGAVEESERTGKRLLHMDIGGGTANLALIEDGVIRKTGCLNVGGRLIKVDEKGILTYVSPVLKGLFSGQVGQTADREQVLALARKLTEVLEAAAGLAPKADWMDNLVTSGANWLTTPEGTVCSFSGGVADCIETAHPFAAFGDMGPELGIAIRESRLCAKQYRLGRETIRATVIGAGCHSAQLSGSTVFYQNITFPLKNLPVVPITASESREELAGLLALQDARPVLAMTGAASPGYAGVAALARHLAECVEKDVILALEQDMAKALGQQLALQLGPDARILCIDRVRLEAGSYLDVGAPVGPALPVVVKTLILSR